MRSIRLWLPRSARHALRLLQARIGHRPSPVGNEGKLRLHLGCGQDYWPGYVNIDADQTAPADVHMDFTHVAERFERNSSEEVVMIHSLGYLNLWQARELFRDVHALLVEGGTFVVETPDLAKCAAAISMHENDLPSYLEAARAIYGFDLQYIQRRARFRPYAFGWSWWHLQRELHEAGFAEVAVMAPQTHGPALWRDMRIVAVK